MIAAGKTSCDYTAQGTTPRRKPRGLGAQTPPQNGLMPNFEGGFAPLQNLAPKREAPLTE